MSRHVLDDGHVAISVEGICGVIRILDRVPCDGDDMPDYTIHGEWVHFTDEVVKLQGFSRKERKPDGSEQDAGAARLSVRHMMLICRWALEHGYRYTYVERQSGRRMPWSEQIIGGDFDGWWRGDLAAARLSGRRKKRSTQDNKA